MTRAIVARRRRAAERLLSDGQRDLIAEARTECSRQIETYRAEMNQQVRRAQDAFHLKCAGARDTLERRRRDIIEGNG